MLEHLENKEKLSVKELKDYEDIVKELYEKAFGKIFEEKDGAEYDKADDSKHKWYIIYTI